MFGMFVVSKMGRYHARQMPSITKIQRQVVQRTSNTSDTSDTMRISQKCYNDLEKIKKDVSILKYYCEGIFSEIGRRNNPNIMPSAVIKWLEKDLKENEKERLGESLKYSGASQYIHYISGQNDFLDKKFIEKYNELQDVQKTWDWFNNYFSEYSLREPASKYLQTMAERDAKDCSALLELEKKGIFFSNDGKTVIINPSLVTE
jgi:hypothetical protein